MCIAASAQIFPLRSRISAQDQTNSLLKAEALICGDTESELKSRQESLPIFSASLAESFCHAIAWLSDGAFRAPCPFMY